MKEEKKKIKQNNRRRISFITVFWIIFFLLILVLIFWSIYNIHRNNVENEITSIDSSIPIPDGFYFVGGTKDSGFVISDNKSDYKKGTSHKVAKKLKGNQFVWVPVEKPISNNINEALEIKENGQYPMAIKNESGYNGLFYFFDITTSNCYLNQGQSTYKEPDITNGQDASKLQEYQDKYNNMIKSVEKYKGFYVSRYEVGNLSKALSGNEKVNSKYGQDDISNISWNDIYDLIPKMYERDDLVTEMIWGSQWDQIVAWYFRSDEYRNSVFNSYNLGNYSGNKATTGSKATFSLKNIYDIYGNVSELTQEKVPDLFRVAKGGSYNDSGLVNSIDKCCKIQKGKEMGLGSRITMYINK